MPFDPSIASCSRTGRRVPVRLSFTGLQPRPRWRRALCAVGVHEQRHTVTTSDGVVVLEACLCGDAREAGPFPPTLAGVASALYAGLPAVRAIHAWDVPGKLFVRVRLSRWTWLALGLVHGFARGRAADIVRQTAAATLQFGIEVT